MLSDIAKTFKAAGKEVKRLVHSNEVWEYLSNKQVVWEYIVEKAWCFWEWMAHSVKICLRKHIGRSSLMFEDNISENRGCTE